jgi:hypothetical protein
MFDDENAPKITSLGDAKDNSTIPTATYDEEVTLTWGSKIDGTPLVNVTSVALIAPSASTHSFNMNQRLVWLPISKSTRTGDEGTLTFKMPPKPEVAPPQYYLLFVNNVKTHSSAWWIRLDGPAAAVASGP